MITRSLSAAVAAMLAVLACMTLGGGMGLAAPAPAVPAGMRAACPEAPRQARCFALFAPQVGVNRLRAAGRAAAPSGWGATDLESAYSLPVDRATSSLVAISIAFDAPHLEQDLNVYRSQYGLPPCTTANGCFQKVNQDGAASPLPSSDAGWAVEASLDVEMVSAACPHCRILVVEANFPDFADLAASEDRAVAMGAPVVSNSYGGRETGAVFSYAPSYDHPGHVILAASGDLGFTAAQFPAVLGSVTAVGGTTLARSSGPRGWAEAAWAHGGSGCSAYVAKPSWQHDPDCGMRTTADVSAVGDGVAMYDSDQGGWLTVGGTSVSSPLVAGIYGLAGNAGTIQPGDIYQHAGLLDDVTSGTNDDRFGGAKCGNDYLCVAGPGYDAPTGLGTPNGIAAF